MDLLGLCYDVQINVQDVIKRIEQIEKDKRNVDPDNSSYLSKRNERLSGFSGRLANLLDKWHDLSMSDFRALPNSQGLLGSIQQQCTSARSRRDGILLANYEEWAAFEQLLTDCASFIKDTNAALQAFEKIDRALDMQPKRELPMLPGSSPNNAPDPSFAVWRSHAENPLPHIPPRTVMHNMKQELLEVLPEKQITGAEVDFPPEEIVFCRGAMILQETKAVPVPDITTKYGDELVCKYCHLTLPRLDSVQGQGVETVEHWNLLGRSHILACSSYSSLTPCYLCLQCEKQKVFLSVDTLEIHLKGTHAKV